MSEHSRVLIRGGNVPGLSMEVVVPTSHTFCTEAAKQMYPFEGAQYIWVRSWQTDDAPERKRPVATGSGDGGSAMGLLFLLMPLMLIGAATGGLEVKEQVDTTPEPTPIPSVEVVEPVVAPTIYYEETPLVEAPSTPVESDKKSDYPTTLPLFPAEPMPWETTEDLTGNPDFIFE